MFMKCKINQFGWVGSSACLTTLAKYVYLPYDRVFQRVRAVSYGAQKVVAHTRYCGLVAGYRAHSRG